MLIEDWWSMQTDLENFLYNFSFNFRKIFNNTQLIVIETTFQNLYQIYYVVIFYTRAFDWYRWIGIDEYNRNKGKSYLNGYWNESTMCKTILEWFFLIPIFIYLYQKVLIPGMRSYSGFYAVLVSVSWRIFTRIFRRDGEYFSWFSVRFQSF